MSAIFRCASPAEQTSQTPRQLHHHAGRHHGTRFLSAQRTSAWADVARRIAHEIKNPLTPIQLSSAERIRRKFGKVITEDKAVFRACTETIVRQVERHPADGR